MIGMCGMLGMLTATRSPGWTPSSVSHPATRAAP